VIRLVLAATALALATPAGGQVLGGQAGERFDGYLGVLPTASAAVRRQVAAINLKRRLLYSNLAASKGVSPQEVGLTAACTTLARVGVGELYFTSAGGWQRRAAGQAAPRPAYCG
jgi:uncharacterized protein YdbL (DUF1318 family)